MTSRSTPGAGPIWKTWRCCKRFSPAQADQAGAKLLLDAAHLRAANSVIANNPKLFEKQLWSELGHGDLLTVVQ